MSLEAVVWAQDRAPYIDKDPTAAAVLVAYARSAEPDGTGAYPTVGVLMWRTRLSDRTVQRAVDRLSALGLIRPGDPGRVAHLPAENRPDVYDLAMELSREQPERKPKRPKRRRGTPTSPGGATERRPTPPMGRHADGHGASERPERGDSLTPVGCHSDAQEVPGEDHREDHRDLSADGASQRRPIGQSGRETKDLDLAQVAVEAAEECTGKQITREHGQKIVNAVLGGRPVGDPAAYLRKAIANDPIRWLRLGEGPHDVLARLMGTTPPLLATPDPLDDPPPPPGGQPAGTPPPEVRAQLERFRRGTALHTPRPAAPRIERTPDTRPDLVPDPDADRIAAHRANQLDAALRQWAAENGKPFDTRPPWERNDSKE